ncbi:hypothetical protein AGMMS50256_27520 [Betaproteobacteria bacterium]|nr:hypothetical protein AGMMS50256_27520 [Betaproteobacteria bacterium]
MSAWPDYAKVLLESYSESRESALIRTEMESGPPKQARVRSRVMITRNITAAFASDADYLAFLDWYSNDIDEGALWFEFFDDVRNSIVLARFAEGGLQANAIRKPSEGIYIWELPCKLESWG